MYRAVFALAIAGGVILYAAAQGDAQPQRYSPQTTPAVQRWEYKSLNEVELHRVYGEVRKNKDIGSEPGWVDRALTGLGTDGWELVTVERERFYLKRPMP